MNVCIFLCHNGLVVEVLHCVELGVSREESIHNHNIEFVIATDLSRHGLAEVLAAADSSANSLVNNFLKTSSLEALDGSVSGSVGAGDIAAKLLGLLGRRDKHASGTETGLRGETSSLLDGETLRDGAGDEVLDHHEEVSWAGSYEKSIVSVVQSIGIKQTSVNLPEIPVTTSNNFSSLTHSVAWLTLAINALVNSRSSLETSSPA